MGQRLKRASYKTALLGQGGKTVAQAVLMGRPLVWSQAEASLASAGNAGHQV